jgi:hypothetical protein
MKTKFTPGPWEFKKGTSEKFSKVIIGGKEICFDMFSKYSQEKSNAKLIAASPTMFAELERLYEKYGEQKTLDILKSAL